MKKVNKIRKQILAAILAAALTVSGLPMTPAMTAHAAFSGSLTSVAGAETNGNVAEVSFNEGAVKAKITFLEDGIFRYNVDPSGEFSEYGTVNNDSHNAVQAKIPQYPDSSNNYSHPEAKVSEDDTYVTVSGGKTTIKFEKATAKMTVEFNGKVVMKEKAALSLGSSTTQTLEKNAGENFYGGGTQNGRFVHTGEVINIANESNWVDGGVASPNPFYYTTEGYGVLRNTFKPGSYNFGKDAADTVTTVHNENEYDAYIFLSDADNKAGAVQDILSEYFHVTGNPILLPEYAFYEGHLNCYNRDSWTDTSETGETGAWTIKGSSSAGYEDETPIASAYKEFGKATGYVLQNGMNAETLNGEKNVKTQALDKYPEVTNLDKFSARGVIDQYTAYDMPVGYFLPNDGYGCGYGQNGYYMTGGVDKDGNSSEDRLAAVAANVENLRQFTEYAQSKGLETGLWTQSNLSPDSNANTSWHLLRDFRNEVKKGGITTLKTDVAWVGPGYNFQLNGTKTAYDIVTEEVSKRPNIITLDGWAASQRFGAIWTGDQTGGNWEYIRFHVPTYIGQSLSGNPNIGSDMDGIFGGNAIVSTRDTQWKVFTPLMLNMDGWGSYAKTPQTFGDPYTGINRMYLKLKAQLLPYIYTSAASAANIDTGNGDAGIPMIRAMFLEYPEDAHASSKNMQYQFMFGKNILVAPIYTEVAKDEVGNDVRNNIYLPDENQVWIDYFTGEQYQGGQTLNGFDAPIWKLPLFVKNGAIVPMWEENNNPRDIDKANRIVEFWPDGESDYTMFEDDGISANANSEEADGYGKVNVVDYGSHVSTKFTSKVTEGTAVLTAEKSTGSYEGYDQNKNTTFVVNVSEEPKALKAMNGSEELTAVKANSKEAVLDADVEAGKYVYFYDEAPAIETYGVEAEDEFAEMMADKTSSPKLYVKFAKTDAQANAQTLTIEGFANDGNIPEDKVNENLAAPEELTDDETRKTPTSNTLTWQPVEGATSYEILVDGVINTVGKATEYTHIDQPYNSEHTYQVRSRNAEGYSAWSEPELKAKTALDPWRNAPEANITWNGGDSWGALKNATDHDLGSMFHSTNGDVVSNGTPFIYDFGDAYELDKFEYYGRSDNYGNGTVQRMDIYTSLDGKNWTKAYDSSTQAADWAYDAKKTQSENVKTVDLSGLAARYVKLITVKSKGGFLSANEMVVYKKDGTKAFAVGSSLANPTVQEGDYGNMKNYLAATNGDGIFETQIVNPDSHRFGDINGNGLYEVYDYAYTMFKLDGGTKKQGKVSGNMLLIPSKEEVKAGEEVTIDVYADNVENVNAFGGVLACDLDKLGYKGAVKDLDIAQMEDLTKQNEKTGAIHLAFANRGDQALYSGRGVVATITMVAKEDCNIMEAMDLSSMMLIGPGFDFVECQSLTNPELPPMPEADEKYAYGEDFTMTITNEAMREDDGSNVEKLIQQGSYEGLFNEDKDREFELLWNIEANYEKVFPEYVKVPLTLHMDLKEDRTVNTVKVYNAPTAGNGYMTDASVKFTYTNGTSEEVNVKNAGTVFEFENPEAENTISKVDITVNAATGEQMLTLSEVEVVSGEETLTQDNFNLTITNDSLTEDNGDNVNLLIQGKKFDTLFNGEQGREFELKWQIPGNYVPGDKLPAYVTVPLTLHAAMTEAKAVDSVSMFSADNNGIGYVKEANAVFTYEDGTESETGTITADGTDYFEFKFVNPNVDKKVTNIDVNVIRTENKLVEMTIAEMSINAARSNAPVEGIKPAEDNAKELYRGQLEDINAVITPEDAAYPYFKAESSNPEIVKIITMAGENNVPVYKAYAVGEGKATITLTALEGADSEAPITASYEITVLPGADKSLLVELITKYNQTSPNFYTKESYKALKDAIAGAEKVKDDDAAETAEVKTAIRAMNDAAAKLVELPVTEITNRTPFEADADWLENEGHNPNNVLNNKEGFWESPYYGDAAGLPKDITIALNGKYDLDKVEILKVDRPNGRVLKYEVLVSTDGGKTWSSVGVKETPFEEDISGIRFEAKKVTNVTVCLLDAADSSGNPGATYVDVQEIKFYGALSLETGELQGAVTAYKEYLEKEEFTQASRNALKAVIEEAETVLEKAASREITQEEIEAMLQKLNDTFTSLEKNASQETKDELLDAIDKAESVNKNKYEHDENWKEFRNALDEAIALSKKEDASENEVEAAIQKLNDAKKKLVAKKPHIDEGIGSVTPPAGPGAPVTQPSPSENVATGDETPVALFVVVLLGAAAAFALLLLKKKKHIES